MRTKKSILGWLLTMVLIVVTQSPVQAAIYNQVPISNQAGYDFSLLRSYIQNGWNGLQIGQYCLVGQGERIAPSYGGFLHTKMSYYTTSSSGISLYENIEEMPQPENYKYARTFIIKKPTDFHMAPYTAMKWCIERIEDTQYTNFVSPTYGTPQNVIENVPNYKFYPSINYYGVNYDLDAGSWKDITAWIETKDGKDNGIWKSTEAQYDEAGNLYKDNIWFAYENYSVVLPAIADVAKEGYELRGWGTTTGSEIAPGGTYSVSTSDAVYRAEWQEEKINIKALWEPKSIGAQEVNHITPVGATFTADYEAYYDLTDKGFMYKESSADEWIDVKADEQGGKLTAAVTGLKSDTSYDVKGYFENQTGRIENNVISFRTYRQQSVGDVTVNNITTGGASFSADYICDDPALTAAFKYKKATDSQWMEVAEAVYSSSGKLTATVTNLEGNTQYQVRAFLNTGFEESQSQGDTSFTTLRSRSRNSGISGSYDSANTKVTTPTATTDNPNPSTQATITVTPIVKNDTADVTVSQSTVSDAISKAKAEAEKNGTEKNGIAVEIKADTTNSTASSLSANLPKAAIDALVEAEVKEISINSGIVTAKIDIETLKTIQKEISADVIVSAKKVDNSTLSAEAKAVAGNRPVFDLSITGTNGTKIINFGNGSVYVSIPYTLGADEKAENVVAYYIDDEGKIHEIPNSVYDEESKTLTFVTQHFSKYAVGYKVDEISDTITGLTDIASHWAQEDIEFVTARGLFNGTEKGKFSPDMFMTRGMFVTVLGRLAKADVSNCKTTRFTDVKDDSYYLPYVEWANKNSIVNGTSAAAFDPDQSITREQLAVIIANYAKVMGFDLPQVHAENIFADNAEIESYAKTAVKQMQMAGIITGKNGNMFDPKGTATRAEISAVLKRFLELVEK